LPLFSVKGDIGDHIDVSATNYEAILDADIRRLQGGCIYGQLPSHVVRQLNG